MIQETRRPLLPAERPAIERSLKRERRSGFPALMGRMFALVGLLFFAVVIANTVARIGLPEGVDTPDPVLLLVLQISAALLVLGPGTPIVIWSLRRSSRVRRLNIALYEEILSSGQIPIVEVEATRFVRFIDNLSLGDCFLCEVEPRKCLFLVGGPDEEIIKVGTFPTRTFEVVSCGSGDFETTVRPTSEVVESNESYSVKEIHWPDWEHAEVIDQSMDECMAQIKRVT